MKKRFALTLGMVTVLAVTLTFAQEQGQQRRGRGMRGFSRERQTQAFQAIQQDVTKLQEMNRQMAEAFQNREQFQNMSDEDRAKLRETWTQRRQERENIMSDLELQLAVLKGPRQLTREHEEAMEELKAIQQLASESNAPEVAKRLGALIEKRQKQFDEKMLKIAPQQEQ